MLHWRPTLHWIAWYVVYSYGSSACVSVWLCFPGCCLQSPQQVQVASGCGVHIVLESIKVAMTLTEACLIIFEARYRVSVCGCVWDYWFFWENACRGLSQRESGSASCFCENFGVGSCIFCLTKWLDRSAPWIESKVRSSMHGSVCCLETCRTERSVRLAGAELCMPACECHFFPTLL